MAFVVVVNFISREGKGESGVGNQRKIVLAASGAALLLLILGVVLILGGNQELFRGIGVTNAEADLTTGRAHFWPIAIKVFLGHPILGGGFDAFAVSFPKFDTWSGVLRIEQAHNDYLQTLADAGLAGFACVAGFIYLLFRKGLATVAAAGNSFRRNSAIGALAGCFGILIHSFFDFPLRTPSNAFFFLLLAAIATVSVKTTIDAIPMHRHRRRSNAP